MSDLPLLDEARYPGLSERQLHAIPIVLGAPTIKAGLQAADLPSTTWYRWRDDDDFLAACRDIQRDMVGESLSDLKRGLRFSVSKLLGLLSSKDERVSFMAARELLSASLKAIEVLDQEERLRELENAIAPLLAALR